MVKYTMKYKTRFVVVEAQQFNRTELDQIKRFIGSEDISVEIERRIDGVATLRFRDKKNQVPVTVLEGDFIIKNVDGSFSICERNIFYQLYEKT